MFGKTNSQTGGAIKGEKLNISLTSNQSDKSDLLGAIITVTHPGGTTQYAWEGYELTVDIPPYVAYSVEYSAIEGYATPQTYNSTAIENNSKTLTAEYKTTVVTAVIKSNQSDTSDLANAAVTFGGKTLKNGQSAKIPTGTKGTPSWSAVSGYLAPTSGETTAANASMNIEGTYQTTVLTVTMTDNQSTLDDVANATASVSASGITTQTVKTGGKVKIPTGTEATVTFNALADYKTPAAVKVQTSGATASASGQYLTELVSVTLKSDDGSSVNGAKVTINGKQHTWAGTAITQKVAYGTKYDIVPQALDGFATPASQTGITANQASRPVTLTYTASALKVSIKSNQNSDSTIAAVKATVKYGSTSVQVSDGQTINLPANVAVTITFPEVEGYLAPDPISFTHSGGLSEKTGTYQCELLTVNVTADSGTPTGFEVTISKQETVGVATKYTRLEYIESNGSQYIDTGFAPNQDTRLVAKLTCPVISGSSTWALGARLSSSSQMFGFIASSSGYYMSQYGEGIDNLPTSYNTTEPFTLDKNKNVTSINGSVVATATAQTFSCPANLTLCAMNNNGTINYGKIKLYSCQIYNNGTLIRDYVPALRSDGIAGLYDAVNDTFTASSGSGNFVAGSELSELVATQTSVTGSYKIPFGTSYTIKASDVAGYVAPSVYGKTADKPQNVVVMQYIYNPISITTIRINQTITDPASMITRVVDGGGIEAIRANSHRYVGQMKDNLMYLRQLDDNDGTKYTDGTSAELGGYSILPAMTRATNLENHLSDVWMKLPQFWWKCTEYATDQWDFSVAYGGQPDSSYKEWDGKDLIGVYEGSINQGSSLSSVSGHTSKGDMSQADFKTSARKKGTGFTLVKWKHHCMMAMLFYTQYGHTNCQAKIGAGTDSHTKTTGATNALGMTDTVAGGNGDSNSINFWGLENWWGNKYEFVDNVSVNSSHQFTVTEDDGSTRNAGTQVNKDGYITKMLFGENIDLIPTAANGSATTGFCGYSYYGSGSSRVVLRSGVSASAYGGVAYVDADHDSSYSNSYRGSRLAFRGEIVIV